MVIIRYHFISLLHIIYIITTHHLYHLCFTSLTQVYAIILYHLTCLPHIIYIMLHVIIYTYIYSRYRSVLIWVELRSTHMSTILKVYIYIYILYMSCYAIGSRSQLSTTKMRPCGLWLYIYIYIYNINTYTQFA